VLERRRDRALARHSRSGTEIRGASAVHVVTRSHRARSPCDRNPGQGSTRWREREDGLTSFGNILGRKQGSSGAEVTQRGLPAERPARKRDNEEEDLMRTMIVFVFISLGLSFGCVTNDSRPLPDESAAGGVGQVEQATTITCSGGGGGGAPCTGDCDCSVGGRRCDLTTHTCSGIAVFGGDSSPLKCVSDCQCQSLFPGSSISCPLDSGSYGHCR
jgi:hypothetical protein